jgi:glycosyltransferase involved in cell wall biosynthesis
MLQDRLLPYRVGFVMEQNLGHRTHYRNLLRYVAQDSTIAPTWMPIEFETPGVLARLPLVRSNWSVRASLGADGAVRAARRSTQLDALFYHTQVTSLLSPRHRDIPVVISLDATPVNYDSIGAQYGHASGGRLEGLKRRLNQRAFAAATALVTWCQWAKDSLMEDYGVPEDKVSVIAPGVDLAHWPRRSGRDRALASDGRPLRLLFVGGDFERKGGDVLLACFHRYLHDDCELSIVTQSPVASGHNLHVYRDVTPNSETLLRLYAEADVFVFPTLADCAPLAVPEAMAAALPVITTRVGAIPEMVRDGEQGFLVTPGDVDELRVAVHRLMNSPHLRARLGDRGRATVEADYDTARNTVRLLDVLKAATNHAPALDREGARRQAQLAAAKP